MAVVATRLAAAVDRLGGWADHTVALPDGDWHDVLTDRPVAGGVVDVAPAARPAARRPARRERRADRGAALASGRRPPRASTCVARRRRARPLTAGDGGWWSDDRDLPARHRLRLLRRRRRSPVPTRAAPGSPHGVHGPSRVFDAARLRVDRRRAGPGVDVRGAVIYELHVGTFTAEGTLDAAIDRLDHLVDARRRPGRADAGRRRSRACTAGATTASALYAVHEPYGGPAALQRFVDAAHARGLGGLPRRRAQPPRARPATTSASSARTSPTPTRPRGARRSTSTARVRRGPPLDRATTRCAGSATSTSTRCAWTPCTRSIDDSPTGTCCAELSDEVAALAAELGRPLSLVAETDLNDPVVGHPDRRGRLGHDRAVGRRRAPRDARAGHRRAARLLRRLRRPRGAAQGADRGVRARRRLLDVPRPRLGPPGPARRPTATGSSSRASTTTRSATAPSATARRPASTRAGSRSRPPSSCSRRSRPMLFMGEEWGTRTPWQFFTDHPEPELAAAVRDGRRREFGGPRLGRAVRRRHRGPDPQAPHPFRDSVLDAPRARRPGAPRARPPARLVPHARSPLRRTVPDLASGDLAATDLVWGGASERAAGRRALGRLAGAAPRRRRASSSTCRGARSPSR